MGAIVNRANRTCRWSIGLALAATCWLGLPQAARACTCALELGAGYTYVGSQLPARARGVLWFADHEHPYAATVAALELLELLESGRARTVPHELEAIDPFLARVVPRAGFKPGARYRLTTRGRVATPPDDRVVEFTRASTPIALERASISIAVSVAPAVERMVVGDGSGACRAEVSVRAARVIVEFSPELAPFRDALRFTTEVDGQPWHGRRGDCASWPSGRSWRHPDGARAGDDLLIAGCRGPERQPSLHGNFDDELDERFIPIAEEGEHGLTPGRHSVVVTAQGDDDALQFRSRPVQVELACDPEPPALTRDRGERPQPPNASTPPAVEPRARGCAVAGSDMGVGTWCLLLLGLVARRRRRHVRAELPALRQLP